MHTATITRDAQGVPTGLSAVAKENLASAAIKTITGVFDTDKVLIPENALDSAVLLGVPATLGATVQKRLSTGEFGIPFKA